MTETTPPPPKGSLPTLRAITAAAIRVLDVCPETLTSRSRELHVSRPRWIVWLLAHKRSGLSLNQIGLFFDRDHSSVLHGVRQMGHRMAKDATLAGHVEAVWAEALRLHAKGKGVRFIRIRPAVAPAPRKHAAKAPNLAVQRQTQAEAIPEPKPERRAVARPLKHWSKLQPFSREWWLSNEREFRRGLARAYGLEAAE